MTVGLQEYKDSSVKSKQCKAKNLEKQVRRGNGREKGRKKKDMRKITSRKKNKQEGI